MFENRQRDGKGKKGGIQPVHKIQISCLLITIYPPISMVSGDCFLRRITPTHIYDHDILSYVKLYVDVQNLKIHCKIPNISPPNLRPCNISPLLMVYR